MQKSMWWCFLLTFGGIIGGIHALGCLARPASAQSPTAEAPVANVRTVRCESTHWRDLMIRER